MRIKKSLAAFALAGALAATFGTGISVSAENQVTDGTEIQVMEAEQLEVQLGKEWAGREFQLKTDAGLYPGTITVGDDGVLRTELGGSTHYILTCMITGNQDNTEQAPAAGNGLDSADAPVQEGKMESGFGENAPGETKQMTPTDASTGPAVKEGGDGNTVVGIPIRHLVLFLVGLVAAVGGLIAIHIVQKRREEMDGYEEEDYDEEDE